MIKKFKIFESVKGETRKIFWIVPTNDRFDDAVVRLMMQFTPTERESERIRVINDALALVMPAKENLPQNYLALLTCEFEFKGKRLIRGPYFFIKSFEEKDNLESDDYIFVGFKNMDKEEYDLIIQTKNFNL